MYNQTSNKDTPVGNHVYRGASRMQIGANDQREENDDANTGSQPIDTKIAFLQKWAYLCCMGFTDAAIQEGIRELLQQHGGSLLKCSADH